MRISRRGFIAGLMASAVAPKLVTPAAAAAPPVRLTMYGAQLEEGARQAYTLSCWVKPAGGQWMRYAKTVGSKEAERLIEQRDGALLARDIAREVYDPMRNAAAYEISIPSFGETPYG